MQVKHKKFIAKEIIILLSTSAIFGLILFIAWICQPKRVELIVLAGDFVPNPKKYSNTKDAYLAAFYGEPLIIASESYKKRSKEYEENIDKINKHWYIITIIEIILLAIVYPIRILYFIIKWSLNTLKQ